ncbi:uncharacterized protein LOC142774964 [Rhipicephalus microplus]|uniref:uncharacterized protein LOC142774964 n=1 Tax=Rhipicephalus microplus TaxID=6941 RepID=UPI003F6B4B57
MIICVGFLNLQASENVSNNTLLEYVMMNCVFEAILQVQLSSFFLEPIFTFLFLFNSNAFLLQLLADKHSRAHCGYDAVLVLTIFVSYRKYEAANPYIVKLSIVDNELALNGYGMVVSTALAEFNRQFVQEQAEPQAGLLSTVTNFVGTMFLADEATPRKDSGSLRQNPVQLQLPQPVVLHLRLNTLRMPHCQGWSGRAFHTVPSSILGGLSELLYETSLKRLELSGARGLSLLPLTVPMDHLAEMCQGLRALSLLTVKSMKPATVLLVSRLKDLVELHLGDCVSWSEMAGS